MFYIIFYSIFVFCLDYKLVEAKPVPTLAQLLHMDYHQSLLSSVWHRQHGHICKAMLQVLPARPGQTAHQANNWM